MTEKEIEKQLHRLYDPEGQYRINQKYSFSDKHVYTQEGDKYHWLTISRTGKNIYSVTKQGKSVLELLKESKRESERTSTIGRNKPKNKGDRSL